MTPTFCVIDLETTGLEIRNDMILELGAVLLDENLVVVDRFHTLVNDSTVFQKISELRDVSNMDAPDAEKEVGKAKFILDMHRGSGLLAALAEAEYTRSVTAAQEVFEDWLYRQGMRNSVEDAEKGVQVHLVGSSLHFDAAMLDQHMPGATNHFFHRRLDVSAFKVIVDRFMPDAKAERDQQLNPRKMHRSLSDCIDTLDELNWYAKKFGMTVPTYTDSEN